MIIIPLLLWFLQQPAPAKDPHGGKFTAGTGRTCASCHDAARPTAEDTYRAAKRMSTMVDGVNKGPLKPYGSITCFTCHRAGGPNHNLAHPPALNRSDLQKLMNEWPGDTRDSEAVRRSMSEYSISLGVKCDYCHVPGNWHADDKRAMKTTRVMIKVMDEFPKHFEFASAAAFTCFTCHQGQVKTQR